MSKGNKINLVKSSIKNYIALERLIFLITVDYKN